MNCVGECECLNGVVDFIFFALLVCNIFNAQFQIFELIVDVERKKTLKQKSRTKNYIIGNINHRWSTIIKIIFSSDRFFLLQIVSI